MFPNKNMRTEKNLMGALSVQIVMIPLESLVRSSGTRRVKRRRKIRKDRYVSLFLHSVQKQKHLLHDQFLITLFSCFN